MLCECVAIVIAMVLHLKDNLDVPAHCTATDGYNWRMKPSLRVDTLAVPCNTLVKMIGCPTRFTTLQAQALSGNLQGCN